MPPAILGGPSPSPRLIMAYCQYAMRRARRMISIPALCICMDALDHLACSVLRSVPGWTVMRQDVPGLADQRIVSYSRPSAYLLRPNICAILSIQILPIIATHFRQFPLPFSSSALLFKKHTTRGPSKALFAPEQILRSQLLKATQFPFFSLLRLVPLSCRPNKSHSTCPPSGNQEYAAFPNTPEIGYLMFCRSAGIRWGWFGNTFFCSQFLIIMQIIH